MTIAGIVGNILEWYDFAVYGFLAPIIGELFFPAEDPTVSIIAAFGAFAAGFLVRPFGSLLFGHIGDKLGRRQGLILSVTLMAIPTFTIGLLPDYAAIGATASVLLVLMRMLQGLSVGGEYTTSIVFLVENSPPNRRAFYASWGTWGAVAGILTGSAVGALVVNFLTPDQVTSWGWRLPFLLGLVIGLAGLYLRRQNAQQDEIPVSNVKSPVIEAFRDHWRAILKVAGINIVMAAAFYMCFVYVTTWLQETVHVSPAKSLDINSLNMFLLLLFIPPAATLADHLGRKPMLISGTIGVLLFAYPLFSLMHHDDSLPVFLGQFGFVILMSMILGTYPAVIAEMLPSGVRVSAISIGYNLCLAIFGGTTPLVCAYLIARTGDDLSPAFYLMATAVVSLVVLLTIPETSGKDIHTSSG